MQLIIRKAIRLLIILIPIIISICTSDNVDRSHSLKLGYHQTNTQYLVMTMFVNKYHNTEVMWISFDRPNNIKNHTGHTLIQLL